MWETSGHLIESPSRPRCLQHGGGHERGFTVQRKYFPPSVTLYFLYRMQSFPLGWISMAIGHFKHGWKRGWRWPWVLTICTEISVKNFRQMALYFLGHRKQERDWVIPFTKYRKNFHFLSTWSLTLVIQTNGTENFGRFGENGKKLLGYLERYYFFPENIHRDEPFHVNSPRNFRVFHTNGKRSLFWYKPSCFIM